MATSARPGHDPADRRPGSAHERDRERLVGTLRHELLDRVLILGRAHLRAVLTEYEAHYNTARPHQGIGQRVPTLNTSLPASRQAISTLARSAENLS